MAKNFKLIVILIILVAVLTFALNTRSKFGGPIKIGVIAPFSGNAATYGEQVKKGIDIALSEINKGGKQKIDLIYEDNQFDPKLGLSAYNKLVNVDKVKYLISFGGNVCPVINPKAQQDKVVNFATGCNTLDFNDSFSYNFRFDVSEAAASKALIDYAKDSLQIKKLALLYVNNDWGAIVSQTIKDAAKIDGIVIVDEEKFNEQDRDIHTQLTKLKSAQPDSLFFVSLVNFTPTLLKQVREMGIRSHLLTNISIQGTSPSILGSVSEGVIYSAPKIAQVENSWNKTFNEAFPDPDSRNFASWGFDSISLISDALTSQGDNSEKVAEYLHKTKDYAGAFGVINYDSRGELKLNYQIKTIKSGKFVSVE